TKAGRSRQLAAAPGIGEDTNRTRIVHDRVTTDRDRGLLAQSLDAAQSGREGAGDPAVAVVAGRIWPVERHVDAVQLLQAAQVDVGPAGDGARLSGALDPREEPHRVEEQRRRARMGEQLGPDEPQHGWPV